MDSLGNGFSRQFFTESLRIILKELGLTGNFSGHSFRRDVATSALEAGLSDAEIQLQDVGNLETRPLQDLHTGKPRYGGLLVEN